MTDTTMVEVKKFQEIEGGICTRVLNWTISTPESRTVAADALALVRGLGRKADEIFGPSIKAAYDAHKAVLKLREDLAGAPVKAAESHLLAILKGWDAEQAKLAAEAERKAREEAALLDQEQLAVAAECEGHDDMAKAIRGVPAYLARATAEEWAVRKEQERAEAAQLALAAEAEAAGATEAAEAIVSAPVVIQAAPALPPAPVMRMAAPTPAPSAASARDNWKARVVNLSVLVKAVAAGEMTLDCVEASMPSLNKVAQRMKRAGIMHGVELYNDPIYSTNARRA